MVFLEILQNLQENTGIKVSILIKLQASGLWTTASEFYNSNESTDV